MSINWHESDLLCMYLLYSRQYSTRFMSGRWRMYHKANEGFGAIQYSFYVWSMTYVSQSKWGIWLFSVEDLNYFHRWNWMVCFYECRILPSYYTRWTNNFFFHRKEQNSRQFFFKIKLISLLRASNYIAQSLLSAVDSDRTRFFPFNW